MKNSLTHVFFALLLATISAHAMHVKIIISIGGKVCIAKVAGVQGSAVAKANVSLAFDGDFDSTEIASLPTIMQAVQTQHNAANKAEASISYWHFDPNTNTLSQQLRNDFLNARMRANKIKEEQRNAEAWVETLWAPDTPAQPAKKEVKISFKEKLHENNKRLFVTASIPGSQLRYEYIKNVDKAARLCGLKVAAENIPLTTVNQIALLNDAMMHAWMAHGKSEAEHEYTYCDTKNEIL